jgi:membrane protein required for beta-lactamase induction
MWNILTNLFIVAFVIGLLGLVVIIGITQGILYAVGAIVLVVALFAMSAGQNDIKKRNRPRRP